MTCVCVISTLLWIVDFSLYSTNTRTHAQTNHIKLFLHNFASFASIIIAFYVRLSWGLCHHTKWILANVIHTSFGIRVTATHFYASAQPAGAAAAGTVLSICEINTKLSFANIVGSQFLLSHAFSVATKSAKLRTDGARKNNFWNVKHKLAICAIESRVCEDTCACVCLAKICR